MILKKHQGNLIEIGKTRKDIFTLDKELEKAVLTRIKIKSNSNLEELNVLGEVPNYLMNKEISITNMIKEISDNTRSVTQYFFTKEDGLRASIRTYALRSMQYLKF